MAQLVWTADDLAGCEWKGDLEEQAFDMSHLRCSHITTVAEKRFSTLVNATPQDFGCRPLDACPSAAAVTQCSGQATTMSSAWILNSGRWVAIAVQLRWQPTLF